MGDCTVFQGGPIVHEAFADNMLWLHTHGDIVPSAQELAPSMFVGGSLDIAAAVDSTRSNRGRSSGLRLFRGFCAWSLQQLQIELQRGIWVHARAECPSATFELCLGSASFS